MGKKSWVEVSGERLVGNYRALESAAAVAGQAERTKLLAVVKANGYGHGAGVAARFLVEAGAAWFGVTDAAEGAKVRGALRGVAGGEAAKILVMCGAEEDEAEAMAEHGLTPVVWEAEQMRGLARVGESLCRVTGGAGTEGPDARLGVHLEIDTGMSRQGVEPGQRLAGFLLALGEARGLRLDGVMTHFASAEVAGSAQTLAQRKGFEAGMEQVLAAGFQPAVVHAGNTSTVDNADGCAEAGKEMMAWLSGVAERAGAVPMVRTGLGLYGYALKIAREAGSSGPDAARVGGDLRPVMTWKTRVAGLREVEPGTAVGYNGTFVARRRMRLALLPVGYADGLRRELSASVPGGGGWVRVRGKRAGIVGRVSMNLTVVDVTEIDGVAVGEEVVLLGDGVTAEDHARLAGTIAYEILCGVGRC